VASAQTVSPQDDYSGYFTFLPYYLSADANRRGTTEDGRGAAIAYGHHVSDRTSWEFQALVDSISTSQGDLKDFNQYGLGIDLAYWLADPEGAAPFLLIGTGVVRNDVLPESAKDTDLYGNVGIGFVTAKLGRSQMRIRGELRYVRDKYEVAAEGEKNDRRISIGLQIPLGRQTVERVVEREVVRESVVREEVPARIVDSDNDGVPDQNDQCPGTLEGLATDNRGCASTRPQAVRLADVNFELNSATLTAEALETLRQVVAALRGEPNLRAEIGGHTDSSGSDEHNLRLSQERAAAVLEFLTQEGISRGRLEARGYGEARPEADNSTEAGRQRNRRVEFSVLD
jgi:OOP family OmpA-OmpF porin